MGLTVITFAQPALRSTALLQDGSPGVTVDPRGTTTPLVHATFSGACRQPTCVDEWLVCNSQRQRQSRGEGRHLPLGQGSKTKPSHRGMLRAVVRGIGATGRRLGVQRVVLVLQPALASRMVVYVVRPVRAHPPCMAHSLDLPMPMMAIGWSSNLLPSLPELVLHAVSTFPARWLGQRGVGCRDSPLPYGVGRATVCAEGELVRESTTRQQREGELKQRELHLPTEGRGAEYPGVAHEVRRAARLRAAVGGALHA